MATAYKVVKYDGLGGYTSAIASGFYGLEYRKNHTTYPVEGTGGIFVFRKLEDAVNFSHGYGYRILEGEAEGLKRKFRVLPISCVHIDTPIQRVVERMQKFWQRRVDSLLTLKAPEGTWVCASFTPKVALNSRGEKLI